MIDYSKFKYRVGDRIRRIGHEAEYSIVEIQETFRSRTDTIVSHYKIRNLSPGCKDHPIWYIKYIIHQQFEPCNPAVKLLFDKKEPVSDYEKRIYGRFRTVDEVDAHVDYNSVYRDLALYGKASIQVSTPVDSITINIPSSYRVELAQPDSHSLDALRYSVLGQPSVKKVSR